MIKSKSDQRSSSGDLYGLYEQLDRLEELAEDMDELEVTSREEIDLRIGKLNTEIDALEAAN